jgi:hypothetical protein
MMICLFAFFCPSSQPHPSAAGFVVNSYQQAKGGGMGKLANASAINSIFYVSIPILMEDAKN